MMKTWKVIVSVVGAILATQSFAGTYTARFATGTAADEINGSGGEWTAGSLLGAGRMCHKFWSNGSIAETDLLNLCKSNTPTPTSWPEQCSGAGMSQALRQLGASWIYTNFAGTLSGQQSAIDQQLSGVKNLESPSLVPLYGHADHWGTVFRMVTMIDNGQEIVQGVFFFDGGAASQGHDSGWDSYLDGVITASSSSWRNLYYKIVTGISSSDPAYGTYPNAYEPPDSLPPQATFRVAATPSPLRQGDVVTRALVRDRAEEALLLGGLDKSSEDWNTFASSSAALPFEVNGVWPNGTAWDYYLVPFVNGRHQLVGMAILDKQTLAYQMSWTLAQPRSFGGFAHEHARQAAQATLRAGETLGAGILTWDPVGSVGSPLQPYYEFPISHNGLEVLGAVHVRLDDGSVSAVDACQLSRRANLNACDGH